jgi:hypothetical protein
VSHIDSLTQMRVRLTHATTQVSPASLERIQQAWARVPMEGGSSEARSEGAFDSIVSLEMQATCNFSGAQSTCVFHADMAVGNSVSVENESVEDALALRWKRCGF